MIPDRADRDGPDLARGEEDQRVEEFVLGEGEGEDAGREEAGRAEGEHDPRHRLEAAGAVDARGLLELARDALEIAHEEPRAERDQERGVGQHDRGERVPQPEPVDDVGHGDEEERLGHEVGGGHPDRDDGGAGEPQAGERVGHHGPEHERHEGRHDGDEHRVVGPGEEVRLGEQVDVVLERRLMDDQRHDLRVVELPVRLDGGDEHPVEREERRHQEEPERQVEPTRPKPESPAANHQSRLR